MIVRRPDRYRQIGGFANVVQPTIEELQGPGHPWKGQWSRQLFHRDRPLVLELGCGRGDFILDQARRFPDRHFLGLDIKGARIWKGARAALDEGLTNIAFIRQQVDFLTALFGTHEISEIWITFPTPYLYKPQKLLIYQRFLEAYRILLKPDGQLHLKTDVNVLYEYALATWNHCGFHITRQSPDLYAPGEILPIPLTVKTQFEEESLQAGRTIKYVCATPTTEEPKPLPKAFFRSPWQHPVTPESR